MEKSTCQKCKSNTKTESVEVFAYNVWQLCFMCEEMFFKLVDDFFQPERSKREDSQKCEMRCSEHCGNTVRGK